MNITDFPKEIQNLSNMDARIAILLQIDAIQPKLTSAELKSLVALIISRYAHD
jgi:hypothetical protein